MKKSKAELPNFLIVGAAKSGTTSLYNYLKQHPDIYMSPVKEPKFITSQFLKSPLMGIRDNLVEKKIIKSYEQYCKLFGAANDKKARGEASADNLYYYKGAIEKIRYYIGDPKIIIIIRNPIERAFSAYTHLIRDHREFLSFEDSLGQEKVRRSNNWEYIWFYKDVGFYYKQIKAYVENLTHVRVYLFDDLKKDSLGFVKKIYEFLEVESSFDPEVNTKYNISGVPINKFINRFLTRPNIFKSMIKLPVKILITKEKGTKLRTNIMAKNLTKSRIRPETAEYLKEVYRDDILSLQDLIDTDLTQWLR